jgi:hypothetical protein
MDQHVAIIPHVVDSVPVIVAHGHGAKIPDSVDKNEYFRARNSPETDLPIVEKDAFEFCE